ncbi:cupin domain-containing protein [Foliimonas ilicis]
MSSASSINPPPNGAPHLPLEIGPGIFRLGEPDAPTEVSCLVGTCSFASPDRDLLISLLPAVIHVRAHGRLTTLVQMIQEETQSDRAARDRVLGRLWRGVLATGRPAHSARLSRSMSEHHLALSPPDAGPSKSNRGQSRADNRNGAYRSTASPVAFTDLRVRNGVEKRPSGSGLPL